MLRTYYAVLLHYFFFFKQKTAYEMRISDWSSDVCSSDLRYRQSFDPAVLQEISAHQAALADQGGRYTQSLRQYFGRPESAWIPRIALDTGELVGAEGGKRQRLANVGIRIGQLEDAIRENIPTKLSDIDSFPLEGGRGLSTDECLFLVPKRALIEGRNDGVCDLTRYAFVGRLNPADISVALGYPGKTQQSFFAKYGKSEARQYPLNKIGRAS